MIHPTKTPIYHGKRLLQEATKGGYKRGRVQGDPPTVVGGHHQQRRAAALLGISRSIVRKYWEGNAVPWDRQTYEREAVVLTPEVTRFIEHCLVADEQDHSRRQHHTARRIYNRLVEECGYTGSESSIRKAVHTLKV